MFIRKSNTKNNIFYVVCADWEGCIPANNPSEAAAIAIELSYKKYGKNMCISPTISVIDLPKLHDSLDAVEHVHLLYTPEVLANAGFHDLSKKFKNIITNAMEKE